jgi:amino-acid N-acetyltransferase
VLRADGARRTQGYSLWLLRVMNPARQPSIRRAQVSDLPGVLQLLRGPGLPTADLMSAPGLQLWVLETEGQLVGVIGLERFGTSALLRSLAVAPGYQRRGFGHELVARLERDARADGVERLVLLTETAEVIFRRLGYELVDRRNVAEQIKQSAEFRSLCPSSAVCMTKSLLYSSVEVLHA